MQKDDYFVIVYQVLNYLYKQLKNGKPTVDSHSVVKAINPHIKADYWLYIIHSLFDGQYITGKEVKHRYIGADPVIDDYEVTVLKITPKGIEYLQSNAMIEKAKDYLNTHI
jgi:hypothetical protein|nr:MAG TPA: YjcQ protein [Caudoviricetes sp.]